VRSIVKKILAGEILVSDGAWGTLLMEKGLKPGECADNWNITNQSAIKGVARAYIDAGSDMIGTNSFGASRIKLERYGLADKTIEINRAAASLSREVAGNDIFVMGTIGPTGKLLMMGEVTDNELYDGFSEQVSALDQGGADAIIIKTMSDIREVMIALRAIKENTSCEAICSMTFEKSQMGGYFTMMGITPLEMVKQLSSLGPDILGSNCGAGVDEMSEVAEEFKATGSLTPIIIQSNAGLPLYQNGNITYPGTAADMAIAVPEMINLGVKIIGGCCGTTPEHIKAIAKKVKEL